MAKTSIKHKIRIAILSLGCPKTLVDSENILGHFQADRYALAVSVTDCDVALINTCSFIREAKEESIERILELIELKKQQKIRAIVVMGCLAQRYHQELREALREVDAFVGSGDYSKIPVLVEEVLCGKRVSVVGAPGYLSRRGERRIALTPLHYRYLKISEGCDHQCSFCTIPNFRGKHRSRKMTDIIHEARRLIDEGAQEIIITGQDTTHFGFDTEGKHLLPELLSRLDNLPRIQWIRLLYAHPSCITSDLVDVMSSAEHICHYLDLPLQHVSERILKVMRRGTTPKQMVRLIREFRRKMPDLVIRTTFIVGFPGETETDFHELLDFMREIRFERLGIFTYSQEDGTLAAKLSQQVPEKTKKRRFEESMLLQQEISRGINQKLMGRTLKVLLDEGDEHGCQGWRGRTYMDAPEVDGSVDIQSKKPLKIGRFYPATIVGTKEYDLVAKV